MKKTKNKKKSPQEDSVKPLTNKEEVIKRRCELKDVPSRLEEVGLPTNPKDIIGRTFQFQTDYGFTWGTIATMRMSPGSGIELVVDAVAQGRIVPGPDEGIDEVDQFQNFQTMFRIIVLSHVEGDVWSAHAKYFEFGDDQTEEPCMYGDESGVLTLL